MHQSELPSTTEESASASARHFLSRCDVEVIQKLRCKTETGGFNGRSYSSCFFGTLANITGFEVNHHEPRTVVNIRKFARSIDAAIPDELYPIEVHMLDVRPHHTRESHPALRLLSDVCDEILLERIFGATLEPETEDEEPANT